MQIVQCRNPVSFRRGFSSLPVVFGLVVLPAPLSYKMKYVAAYLLTVLGGKEPTKENLEALLGSVGIDWEARGDTLLSAMEGKDLEEVLAAGEELLVKGGGGGA
eukprot:COSAG02_NODE_1644_length_11524_cov_76.342232_2_plen_104_part_00